MFKQSKKVFIAMALFLTSTVSYAASLTGDIELRISTASSRNLPFSYLAISGDGNVVTGSTDFKAFRWESGRISFLPGVEDFTSSQGNAVSADGSVIVGHGVYSSTLIEAILWTPAGYTGLGFLGFGGNGFLGFIEDGTGIDMSVATGTSADGSVIVGYSSSATKNLEPFIWTAQAGMQPLIDFPRDLFAIAIASDVSANGTVITGHFSDDTSFSSNRLGFRYEVSNPFTGAGTFSLLGNLSDLDGLGSKTSQGNAISADGSTIVGGLRKSSYGNMDAYQVVDNGLIESLGVRTESGSNTLSPDTSSALDISPNGSIIGYSSGRGAFLWDEINSDRLVSDILRGQGVDVSGWHKSTSDGTFDLSTATGISDDGTKIVGSGYKNGVYAGWIADLTKTEGPLSSPFHRSDFNNDGNEDILWRNSETGQNWIYLMNGATITSSEPLNTVPSPHWKIAGLGDFNNDGNDDILWRNTQTGQNWIYLMNGTTISVSSLLNTVASQAWVISGVGDFNNDGNDDILWRNAGTGQNWIYLMNGTSVVTSSLLNTIPVLSWTIAGIGDFNNDNKDDILWRNALTGENYIYLMDGTSIVSITLISTLSSYEWAIGGIRDFNSDGNDDILWRNVETGQNDINLMNGTSISSTVTLNIVPSERWTIKQLGDFNGDNQTDIFWRNAKTGQNWMYLMNGISIISSNEVNEVSDRSWKVNGK